MPLDALHAMRGAPPVAAGMDAPCVFCAVRPVGAHRVHRRAGGQGVPVAARRQAHHVRHATNATRYKRNSRPPPTSIRSSRGAAQQQLGAPGSPAPTSAPGLGSPLLTSAPPLDSPQHAHAGRGVTAQGGTDRSLHRCRGELETFQLCRKLRGAFWAGPGSLAHCTAPGAGWCGTWTCSRQR